MSGMKVRARVWSAGGRMGEEEENGLTLKRGKTINKETGRKFLRGKNRRTDDKSKGGVRSKRPESVTGVRSMGRNHKTGGWAKLVV